MAYQRLPETVQTLYAELLEQAIHAEAEGALSTLPRGSFVAKAIRGAFSGGASRRLQRRSSALDRDPTLLPLRRDSLRLP